MNIADVSSCHCIELDYTAIKAYGPINEQKTNGLFFYCMTPSPWVSCGALWGTGLRDHRSIQTISQSIHLSKIYLKQVLQTDVIFVIILLDRC